MIVCVKPKLCRPRFFFMLSVILSADQGENAMAKSHYNFRKRQKELAKKKKKEEKRQRKLGKKAVETDETETDPTLSTEQKA